MSRYVTVHLENSGDPEEEECSWEVRDAKWEEEHDWARIVAGADTGVNEAEAHIIAFALNAVANGHELLSRDPATVGRGWMGQLAYVDEKYDGPTEGVAP